VLRHRLGLDWCVFDTTATWLVPLCPRWNAKLLSAGDRTTTNTYCMTWLAHLEIHGKKEGMKQVAQLYENKRVCEGQLLSGILWDIPRAAIKYGMEKRSRNRERAHELRAQAAVVVQRNANDTGSWAPHNSRISKINCPWRVEAPIGLMKTFSAPKRKKTTRFNLFSWRDHRRIAKAQQITIPFKSALSCLQLDANAFPLTIRKNHHTAIFTETRN